MSTEAKLDARIAEMVRRIVDQFHPEKIILFGSHARGAACGDSDVDLLVVMPVEVPRRKLATEIDLALLGVGLPADVIVATPEELERKRDLAGTIFPAALRDGEVLYDRTG